MEDIGYFMEKKRRLILLMSSVLALFAGALCYYMFRNSNIIFFQLFKIKITHANIRLADNFITSFIKYNLCDGLWLLSGILFLRFLWFNNPAIGAHYITVFIGVALLLELLQLTDYFPGTFDIVDIFTMALCALLEHCINYILPHRRRQKWVKIG